MGLLTVTQVSPGQSIDSVGDNARRQEIADALTPTLIEDYSEDTSQFYSQIDPQETGSESLPGDLAGELERQRFRIAEISGMTYWNQTGTGIRAQSIATASLPSAG